MSISDFEKALDDLVHDIPVHEVAAGASVFESLCGAGAFHARLLDRRLGVGERMALRRQTS